MLGCNTICTAENVGSLERSRVLAALRDGFYPLELVATSSKGFKAKRAELFVLKMEAVISLLPPVKNFTGVHGVRPLKSATQTRTQNITPVFEYNKTTTQRANM
jgi:hypothetical protein